MYYQVILVIYISMKLQDSDPRSKTFKV